MKIIFMGTPEFSVPTLKALLESKHEVVACYTQPDKPKGRGKKVQMSPVKELALEAGLKVYQPKRIRNKEEVAFFSSIDADVAVVIAYGQILTQEILKMPRFGCINIHASLLPKYRGAAPYQWAVMNGETKTGITTMQMDAGIDTGDMLLKKEILIEEGETAGSLHDKLMMAGGNLLLETLDLMEANQLNPIKQEDTQASSAPMLSKDFGKIDWNKPAYEIERLIRGLNPWPSAYTYLNGSLLKIWQSEVVNNIDPQVEAGQVERADTEHGFVVKCGEQSLRILELQLQGKKRMDTEAFLRGHSIEIGTRLDIERSL